MHPNGIFPVPLYLMRSYRTRRLNENPKTSHVHIVGDSTAVVCEGMVSCRHITSFFFFFLDCFSSGNNLTEAKTLLHYSNLTTPYWGQSKGRVQDVCTPPPSRDEAYFVLAFKKNCSPCQSATPFPSGAPLTKKPGSPSTLVKSNFFL